MGGAAMRRVGRAAAALTAALVAATIALAPGPWRSAQARSTGRIASAGARRLVGAPATRAEEASRARALEQLHAHEEQIRAATDFRRPIAGDRATGVDPFLVRGLADGPRAADRAADRFVDRAADRFVGVLRGSSEVVLLDGDLRTIARAPAPRAPTGLTVDDGGAIFVAGELSSEIARYRVAADGIVAAGRIDLGPGRGVRDLAAGPGGVLYAAEARGSRLVTLRLRGGDSARGAGDALLVAARDETPIGRGATRVMRVGPLLLVNCLLEHAVRILRAGSDGRPGAEVARIQHDGPIWAFDAAIVPGQKGDSTGSAGSAGSAEDLILVTAGVEDHPLDRTIGSFGYIDSYLTVYRAALAPAPAPLRPQRLGVTNLSERGIVTPKVVSLTVDSSGGGGRAWVSGYGSEQLASVVWRRFAEPPAIDLAPLPPGTTSLARRRDGALVFADPLLDAWVARAPGAGAPITVTAAGAGAGGEAAGRPPAVRLGEALFFTTVMAPWNRADGATSRFTCETCHFEGGIDGRTHHTGRGDVRATTKPLRGLLANRPYFSRALDPDMATMVNNEFRVAGASSKLVWVDRKGNEQPLPADPHAYRNPRLSPDGDRVAVGIDELGGQIWIYDIVRDSLSRLTVLTRPDAVSRVSGYFWS